MTSSITINRNPAHKCAEDTGTVLW